MEFSQSSHKILPPQLPEVLERPRLLDAIRKATGKKLILIVGQAAQGKSTLAAAYVKHSAMATAWVNLGPEDAEAASLYRLLNQSLNYALQEAGCASISLCPVAAAGPREETSLHREWARSLPGPISTPLQIVLDGADQLPPDASSFRFMRTLLDELPANVPLLVLSRELPPLDVAKLRIRQEATVLSNEELAFTLAETRDFFEKVRNIPLSSEQLQKFHRTTEGWIGGLIVIAESMTRLFRTDPGEAISKALPDHFERQVFEYFAEEVFATLPMETKDFLIRSSTLPLLEPAMVRELTGNEKAFQVLDTLARKNLFVQSIYDREKGPLFRYHQLFGEFLKAKLHSFLDEKSRRKLFLQTGSLFEQRHQLEDAVRVYLEGKAYAEAIPALQQVGMQLLSEGRLQELAGWIGAVPAEMIADNSRLLFYRYMVSRLTNFEECLPDLTKAYELARNQGQVEDSLLCLAYLIEASVTKGHFSIPTIDVLIHQAEELVKSQDSARHPHQQALLYLQMGLACLLKLGHPRKGILACQNALLLARDIRDLPLQISALINIHFCHSTLGETENAWRTVKRVDHLLTQCPLPELQALHGIESCQVHWFQGDFTNMRQRLQRAREIIEEHGINYLYPVYLLYELSLQRQIGSWAEAVEIGENLANVAAAAGNRWLTGNVLLQTGLAYYFLGRISRARELYEQAREIVSSSASRGDFHMNCTSVTLALTACRLKIDNDAATALAETIRDWQAKGIHIFLKEAHLAMALLQWQQGNQPAAAEHLAAGLKLARDRGFHLNLLLNREDLLRCHSLAIELELGELWSYAFATLTAELADLAEPELNRLMTHKIPPIAEKAQEVRIAIHRRRIPPLRIETLGGFQVWRGGSLMPEKDWRAQQPKLLLKALIARGCRNVARDVLIEDLWPEISPSAGVQNFRVVLHRLRKILEPSMNKEFGPSYVRLKANLISLDEELCWVDAEELQAIHRQIPQVEREGDGQRAMALFEEALQLYRGDFLAEELYQPWAQTAREELRRQYIELLFHAAAFYEQQGKIKKAIGAYSRILAADPLDEQACRRLMTLCADRGMRNEALRVYETYRRALERELGTNPDELTVSIYQMIADSSRRQQPPDRR